MRIADWLGSYLPSSATWLTVSLGATGPVVAQATSFVSTTSATVVGQVVDTAGTAIGEAEVVVLTPDSAIVARAKTDDKGGFMLDRVPVGGPYTIMARRVGYWPARGNNIRIENSDTLNLRFELPFAESKPAPLKKKKNK